MSMSNTQVGFGTSMGLDGCNSAQTNIQTEANVFSQQLVQPEALERTYREFRQYEDTWSIPNMPSKVLFDMLHAYCREKGYPIGGGTATDREHHFAELMLVDSFAAKLMQECFADKNGYYESICKRARALSRGNKRKTIV